MRDATPRRPTAEDNRQNDNYGAPTPQRKENHQAINVSPHNLLNYSVRQKLTNLSVHVVSESVNDA